MKQNAIRSVRVRLAILNDANTSLLSFSFKKIQLQLFKEKETENEWKKYNNKLIFLK